MTHFVPSLKLRILTVPHMHDWFWVHIAVKEWPLPAQAAHKAAVVRLGQLRRALKMLQPWGGRSTSTQSPGSSPIRLCVMDGQYIATVCLRADVSTGH